MLLACSVGLPVAKSWMFALSFANMSKLAAHCSHQGVHCQGGHESFAGKPDAQGNFSLCKGRQRRLFSAQLGLVPLLSSSRTSASSEPCPLVFELSCIPRKPRSSTSFAAQEGGERLLCPHYSYIGHATQRKAWVSSVRNGNNGGQRSACLHAYQRMLPTKAKRHFSLPRQPNGPGTPASASSLPGQDPRTGISRWRRTSRPA